MPDVRRQTCSCVKKVRTSIVAHGGRSDIKSFFRANYEFAPEEVFVLSHCCIPLVEADFDQGYCAGKIVTLNLAL
jgi:hypothetical protein